MRLRLVVYVLTAAIAGVLVGVPASSAQRLSPSITGHPILSGTLRGSSVYPAIRGGVGFGPFTKTEQDRHFSLSLRNAPGKLTGKLLTVFAAGHKLGFMRVGSQGTAQLVLPIEGAIRAKTPVRRPRQGTKPFRHHPHRFVHAAPAPRLIKGRPTAR